MPDAVVGYLAEHLEISVQQAEKVLHTLGRHVQDQLNHDERVRVPDLGFFFKKDGEVCFEPNVTLAVAINSHYVHLESVHLSRSDTVYVKTPSESDKDHSARSQRKQQAPLRLLGWSIVLMLLITTVCVFLWRYTQTAKDTATTLPSEHEEEAADIRSAANGRVEEAAILPSTEPEENFVTGIDRNRGGYTVIIGSFMTREDAMTVVQRYRERMEDTSVPLGVIRVGLDDGSTLFRAAVGQAATVDDAVQLKDRLPNLPDDAWVIRITSDS